MKLYISDYPPDYIPKDGVPFIGTDFNAGDKTVEVRGFRDADGNIHVQSMVELPAQQKEG